MTANYHFYSQVQGNHYRKHSYGFQPYHCYFQVAQSNLSLQIVQLHLVDS